MLHSPSPIRHAFYEAFLVLHILAAVTACIGLWYHLAAKPEYAQWLNYLKAAIALWALDRGFRLARIGYRNFGRKMTTATVEVLPGEALRVTLRVTRPWQFQPGQHLYLYMPTVGLWTSHPFTISWCEENQAVFDEEKVHQAENTMSLIIRRRTGFTDALYKKAIACPGPENIFTAKALVEGPYGKIDSFGSYGTVVLVAGGIGITHPLPFVKELVAGYANGTIATRRITLVWIIQTPGQYIHESVRPSY